MNKDANIFPNQSERDGYDLLPCGVVWTDERHRIGFANKSYLDLLGYAADSVVGVRRFYDLLSVGGKIYFETHYAPALLLEGELSETNFELVAKDGTRIPVMINVCRSPSASGGYVYTVFHTKDRREYERELKRARKKAEAGERTKAMFLSSMSHEIRTPLHAILEAGNFLLKDKPRPDQLSFINVLRSAGGSLLSIVNDILDLSKLESGLTVLDLRPVHALQMLRQVTEIYRPQCDQKGVRLRDVKPLADIPLLMADGPKLLQVLNNLVSNAAKFTREGEIVLQLDYDCVQGKHQLSFRVRDTGVGIPQERLTSVFEPFVQAKHTTHAEFGGTGLGLAICQRILKAYNSELKVNSREGEGTEFYFTLVLEPANKQQIAHHERTVAPPEALPPLNHLRILNVDDNQANLLINARYFEEWKLPNDQFADATAALQAMETEVYDLVLLDLRMPEIDGYEVARRIRANPNPDINNLPLIALSASASKDVSAAMLDAGINGLVVKPFEPGYLHHIIKTYGERGVQQRLDKHRPAAEVPTTALDLTDVHELFAGDRKDFVNFLSIVHDDINEALDVLGRCSQTFSKPDFLELKHNLISTLRIFRLGDVSELFVAGKQALEDERRVEFLVLLDQLLVRLKGFAQRLAVEIATGEPVST